MTALQATKPRFGELIPTYGFLTDRQITLALDNGYLVTAGTFDKEGIRHASYTLRLGHRVEVAAAARANNEERRDFNIQEICNGQSVDLHPGDTAKLYSIELLDLPDDVVAFTVARGLMYIESLVPENTYVDPGFRDSLYTTVTNLSNRIIRLNYGDPIARIFFYRLAEQVDRSFARGTALGIKQRLESRRATEVGTPDECNNASATDLLKTVRLLPLGGNQVAALIERQTRYLALLAVGMVSWPLLLLIANRTDWIQQRAGDVIANLIASVIWVVLLALTNLLWRKVKRSS
jgi:deoxycytidine triphosphate deaminase